MLIGFIGAPSCGKSSVAFGLCYHLKKQGYPAEFFAEYARMHIQKCRMSGVPGNGGFEGQKIIYQHDCDSAAFYRANNETISITDGSSLNCYFYNGFNHIDLLEEAKRYDLLFYVSIGDVPAVKGEDANRVQAKNEIRQMMHEWDNTIRPLIPLAGNIIELRGFPDQSLDQMVEQAIKALQPDLAARQQAA